LAIFLTIFEYKFLPMKKIITLLMAVASFVAVQAQTSKEEARRVILGETKAPNKGSTSQNPRDVILGGGTTPNDSRTYPNRYPTSSRQAEVDQVNREYDRKIQSVRNNRYLSQAEKDRAIRQLENDLNRKIREINGEYNTTRKNKKYKGNNGKHLGWEKGKGNPHKNGGKSKGKH
jgi:hypothetical protein